MIPTKTPAENRTNALNNWLARVISTAHFNLTPMAGDLSFRRYFRLQTNDMSYIVMDAPPPQENCRPFITIAQLLLAHGVSAPTIFAQEPEQGFLLLEDFGDEQLLTALQQGNHISLYQKALQELAKIQNIPAHSCLSTYDHTVLMQDIVAFQTWCLTAHLQLTPTKAEPTIAARNLHLISASSRGPTLWMDA